MKTISDEHEENIARLERVLSRLKDSVVIRMVDLEQIKAALSIQDPFVLSAGDLATSEDSLEADKQVKARDDALQLIEFILSKG